MSGFLRRAFWFRLGALLNNVFIFNKLAFVILVMAAANIAVMLYEVNDVKRTVMHDRMDKMRELVRTTRAAVEYFKAAAEAGRLPTDTARRMAFDLVRQMRFDENNYFYIYDYDGVLLVHPFRPDLVGTPRLAAVSPTGQHYVQDLLRVAMAGGGFYTFDFNNGDPATLSRPKLSYGVGIDDWRIAIGGGLYIDDVERSYLTKAAITFAVGSFTTAVALAIAFAVARSFLRPLGTIKARMDDLAAGDLAVEVPYRDRGDEVGSLARALAVFKGRQAEAFYTLRLAAVEMERSRDAAKAADRAKSTFLSAASHDLRQPMQALVLHLDHLNSLVLPDEAQEPLQEIDQVARIVTDMLNAILDISRLDSGAVAVKTEAVPLARLFEGLWARFGKAAEAKGLTLSFDATAAWAWSDLALLDRMLGNLLENAIRYTRSGGIRVGCTRRDGALVIEVRDTGIGIPEESLERIWDEYYQVGNPERDRRKGLGLGLSIVKRTAALLGHRLTVTSAPGIGSSFCVEVPAAPEKTAV